MKTNEADLLIDALIKEDHNATIKDYLELMEEIESIERSTENVITIDEQMKKRA